MCAQLIEARGSVIAGGDGSEEVLIGITDPAKAARGPEQVARESLVRWCVAHNLPVPEAREGRWR